MENFSSLTLSLLHENTVKETQWLTSELKLANERLVELMNGTSGLLHGLQLMVIAQSINFIDTYYKACQGYFKCFSCLFSVSNKGKAAPTILTTHSVVIVLLIVSLAICYGCYLNCLAHFQKTATIKWLLGSESSTSPKHFLGPLDHFKCHLQQISKRLKIRV